MYKKGKWYPRYDGRDDRWHVRRFIGYDRDGGLEFSELDDGSFTEWIGAIRKADELNGEGRS